MLRAAMGITDKPFAFVLMPLDPAFDDVYKLGIKEAAEKTDIIVQRVDEQKFHKETILERIYNQINAADFIIADMTGRNPNVFYEVGYAHAKEKVCVLITKDANDIPFDLKHHRHIVYGQSITSLRDNLRADILEVKAAIAERNSSIQIEMKEPKGELERNDWKAVAKIEITLDFHNRSDTPSDEIEALYYYTGDKWKFSVEGQECPCTKSDLAGFSMRHLIKLPVRRLNPRGGWAQAKIKGEKVMAYRWDLKGKKFEEKYNIKGRSLLRVVTAKNIYDKEFPMDIDVEDFPF
jgi:nucleoside 2-deoxyribosyltransferase